MMHTSTVRSVPSVPTVRRGLYGMLAGALLGAAAIVGAAAILAPTSADVSPTPNADVAAPAVVVSAH